MFDTSPLHCNRVSFCWSAVVHNRQQIVKFASIGHGAPAPDGSGQHHIIAKTN
jgi:hypothetical protein